MTINELIKTFIEIFDYIFNSEICFLIIALTFIIFVLIAWYKTIKDLSKQNKDKNKDKKEK